MRVEEKFNKRAADLVECQSMHVSSGAFLALGVKIACFPVDHTDGRTLSIHLTPDEALTLARELIGAAQHRIARE